MKNFKQHVIKLLIIRCTKRKPLQTTCNMVSVISGHEKTSQNKLFCPDFS